MAKNYMTPTQRDRTRDAQPNKWRQQAVELKEALREANDALPLEEEPEEDIFSAFAPPHRALLLEYRAEVDPQDEWFRAYAEKLIPQPVITASTFKELPQSIDRKCCQFKSCGNTDLYAAVAAQVNRDESVSAVYVYRRSSNDESFFAASTVTELVEQLNDPLYFPIREEE